ncbi:MAG: PepSY-like domain-containing protein [Muribaculaceae bacterium]|nr:PepSY-like domain-containing protein [Muribaculaceae bacterium]
MKRLKRILCTFVAMLTVSLAANAGDNYAHDASALPVAAKTTLQKNFKSKVSLVKVDKDFGRISEYEVIMTDGSEITFDKDGNWKEVEVNISKSVPTGFIPTGVSNYVKANQKGKKVVGIEKKKDGYEVELNNGVEMRFDKQGNFIRYEK